MLYPESKCRKAERIEADIYKSEPVLKYYNQMKVNNNCYSKKKLSKIFINSKFFFNSQSTLLYVQDNTGYENVDLIKAEEIFDSLLIEKMNGYKLPAWVDSNVFAKLKDIADKTFIFAGMTREIQRFRTGLLLSNIWQHISNHESVDNDERRLYIYSTVYLSVANRTEFIFF